MDPASITVTGLYARSISSFTTCNSSLECSVHLTRKSSTLAQSRYAEPNLWQHNGWTQQQATTEFHVTVTKAIFNTCDSDSPSLSLSHMLNIALVTSLGKVSPSLQPTALSDVRRFKCSGTAEQSQWILLDRALALAVGPAAAQSGWWHQTSWIRHLN